MTSCLWEPSEDKKANANLSRFMEFVNSENKLQIKSYDDLYQWSIKQIPDFWEALWKFADIRASSSPSTIIDDLYRMPGAQWFEGARLNFAENLLRFRDSQC